ncbi:M61 family metallopeptidase [Microcoleus sp. FACHB-1515]|uniref:M61 family metallopeptidase n=1 Tax=Cyanophyceae TaxID=3028117 RepID=UPI0016850AFE|nr:M61 family metallopeptidase [Microcoleus sp. FACHB-1515]MBD2091138.1 M61 family metallopeptidase [Microcoleus sp. FACHB-1515]
MTEATQIRPQPQTRTHPSIAYRVAMPEPTNHLFEVTLTVKGWLSDRLDLKMPVWTPGSYLVREYARHLQDFTAAAGDRSLSWRKVSKNHWQIDALGVGDITVRYRIFANELTVRTNHLDATHGFFNPAALCFYIPGFRDCAIDIAIEPFTKWIVTTPLPPVENQPNTYRAADFDTLVDSPFEIGQHQVYGFKVNDKPHEFAIWGQGNADVDRIITDTRKIIQVEADLFGGLPYDRYVFLLHLSASSFGGLEHKNSCTLIYPRFGFQASEKYDRFMQLVAHEFFHLWNIKRIRPIALEKFDYDQENYTPSLWFSEGTTSFYDLNIPFRAGIYSAETFLSALGKEITRYLNTPGRLVQPLAESSFDAWIKLYRRDANSDNSQISYYLKGEMVTLLLDLLIRSRSANQRSFDDVMRSMWQQFGKDEIGFTPKQLQQTIEQVADTDLSEFFDRYLHTTTELPFDEYLQPFGLKLQAAEENLPPFTGMTVKTENGREIVKFVESNSPAQKAGIDAGDELLAIDGLRVTADQISDRLRDYEVGDAIEITYFHQDELRTGSIELAEGRSSRYQLVPVANPTAEQQQNLQGWLGVTVSSIC